MTKKLLARLNKNNITAGVTLTEKMIRDAWEDSFTRQEPTEWQKQLRKAMTDQILFGEGKIKINDDAIIEYVPYNPFEEKNET